jgi:hypothetical protein
LREANRGDADAGEARAGAGGRAGRARAVVSRAIRRLRDDMASQRCVIRERDARCAVRGGRERRSRAVGDARATEGAARENLSRVLNRIANLNSGGKSTMTDDARTRDAQDERTRREIRTICLDRTRRGAETGAIAERTARRRRRGPKRETDAGTGRRTVARRE